MPLDLLVIFLLMQPGMQLVFWDASAHFWLTLNLSSVDTLKYFSSYLLNQLTWVPLPSNALTHRIPPIWSLKEGFNVGFPHHCSSTRCPFFYTIILTLIPNLTTSWSFNPQLLPVFTTSPSLFVRIICSSISLFDSSTSENYLPCSAGTP